jgi:hypothetical protein
MLISAGGCLDKFVHVTVWPALLLVSGMVLLSKYGFYPSRLKFSTAESMFINVPIRVWRHSLYAAGFLETLIGTMTSLAMSERFDKELLEHLGADLIPLTIAVFICECVISPIQMASVPCKNSNPGQSEAGNGVQTGH